MDFLSKILCHSENTISPVCPSRRWIFYHVQEARPFRAPKILSEHCARFGTYSHYVPMLYNPDLVRNFLAVQKGLGEVTEENFVTLVSGLQDKILIILDFSERSDNLSYLAGVQQGYEYVIQRNTSIPHTPPFSISGVELAWSLQNPSTTGESVRHRIFKLGMPSHLPSPPAIDEESLKKYSDVHDFLTT